MAFFESKSPHSSFVVHFSENPMSDFGAWALGYSQAARRLAQSLLSKRFSADYEAYPAVFLYRHSLELYLKAIIVQGGRVNQLRQHPSAAEKLAFHHELPPLVEIAEKVLVKAFPNDTFVSSLLARMKSVTDDLHKVDPQSYGFRYPVSRAGRAPVPKAIVMGLVELSENLEALLDDLETLDFALGGEVYAAEEIMSMITNLSP